MAAVGRSSLLCEVAATPLEDSPIAVNCSERRNLLECGEENVKRLGSFQGVFSPVCLSMFSTLLFLRVGYIVGNAGLLESLFQLCLAYTILLLTASSVCALATNSLQLGGGGVYFLISRTLGPEFGSAVGILFYLANVAGAALFAVGCSEALAIHFGKIGHVVQVLPILAEHYWQRWVTATAINVVNLLICVMGARLFGKTSVATLTLVIMCMVAVSMSFFTDNQYVRAYNQSSVHNDSQYDDKSVQSALTEEQAFINATFDGLLHQSWSQTWRRLLSNLGPVYAEDCESSSNRIDFATVFAVLFSGVTGILAGANLSGELRHPSQSIPKGTLSACAFTFVTYALLFLLTAATCNRELLFKDCHFMAHVVVFKPITALGSVLTTFCASTSCLIGASRVLHAVAKDGMFGRLLGFVVSPLVGVLLSWLLVQLLFFVGSLTRIATLSSVFFLLSYSAVNLSCFALEWASAPNFRPTYEYFTWHSCLLGVLSSLIMMFVVSPLCSSITIVVCFVMVVSLHFFAPTGDRDWGSISQAILFHQVRKYLLWLDPRKEHVKFWRPQVLLLVDDVSDSTSIISFTNALKKGGLYVLGHVIVKDSSDPLTHGLEHEAQRRLMALVDALHLKAFVEVAVSSSLREGVQHLVRLVGIGAMKPNTILMGIPNTGSRTDVVDWTQYTDILNDLVRLKKNICIHHRFNNWDRADGQGSIFDGKKVDGCMDIWLIDLLDNQDAVEKWGHSWDATSLFMLQLACILRMLPTWKHLRCRIFATISYVGVQRAEIYQLLKDIRLKVDLVQPITDLDTLRTDYFAQESHDTVLAIFPIFKIPRAHQQLRKLINVTEDLPPTLFVHGVSPVISTSY